MHSAKESKLLNRFLHFRVWAANIQDRDNYDGLLSIRATFVCSYMILLSPAATLSQGASLDHHAHGFSQSTL